MVTIWILLSYCAITCYSVNGFGPRKRFEYKLSFKGPHLVQRDGTIPFWEHGGSAIASEESVRITPSLRSKRGYVWTKEKMSSPHWEVEIIFKINGRGRIGADGMAFWYTKEKGTEGPVFGSNDKWNGLGVFFDSFDNDGQHNNPYVMAMGNDGTLLYDHNSDGSSQQLGGCLRDFRNKAFPIRAKIEYYQKALTIFFHNGLSNNEKDYELCMRVENVNLPESGHFGISGATGGLADDHDVLKFITHSMQPPTEVPDHAATVSEEEKKRFEQEYEEYRQRLEKAKEDYQKEHPDRKPQVPEEDLYESQDTRELRMIFDGQNNIHETMRQLHHKVDEMIGRQERTLSQISLMGQQQGFAQQQGTPQGQQPGGQKQELPYVDTIRRHEVETVLNHQRDMATKMAEIRAFVNDVQTKMHTLNQQVTGGGAYDQQKHQQDLINTISVMHNDVKQINNKQGSGCPTPPACVTTFYFMVLVIVQLGVFIAYNVYRTNKEASAKKFY